MQYTETNTPLQKLRRKLQTKKDEKKSKNSFKKLLITILNCVIFFVQSVTLIELFVKLINTNTIIIYWTHMYTYNLSHFCCKAVQEVYIKLQNVQKMLHYLGMVDLTTVPIPLPNIK